MKEINLTDYNGNFDAFLEACYQAYLAFWACEPAFEGKKLQRNKNNLEKGKEVDFWGMVEGHDSEKETNLDRYGKVPLLNHLLDEDADDVVFYKRHHKGKIRIELFSQSKGYLMVLQEVGKTERLQFITAHPLGQNQIKKKMKNYEEYLRNENKPL